MELVKDVYIGTADMSSCDCDIASAAGIDDPVASHISWEPMTKHGGANFKTQKIVVSARQITVKRSGKAFVISGLFFITPGVIGLYHIASSLLRHSSAPEHLIMSMFGIFFGCVGIIVLKSIKNITMDKSTGKYFRGKKYESTNSSNSGQQGMLKDIYAIQLICKVVRSEQPRHFDDMDIPFTSYEINLVFKNGKRLNIMDHGDKNAIITSSKQLGRFLNVPVWKAI